MRNTVRLLTICSAIKTVRLAVLTEQAQIWEALAILATSAHLLFAPIVAVNVWAATLFLVVRG